MIDGNPKFITAPKGCRPSALRTAPAGKKAGSRRRPSLV
jgi:hypothetical protein